MQRISLIVEDYHFDMIIEGQHAYLAALRQSFIDQGFELRLQSIEPDTRHTAGIFVDYCLIENLFLENDNCVTIKRAHYVPYWTLENNRDPKQFRLYNKTFNPSEIDDEEAMYFANALRKRVFGLDDPMTERGEKVIILLDPKIAKAQKGQIMSTLDMIKTLRELLPNREIIVQHDPDLWLKDGERAELMELLEHLDIEYDKRPIQLTLREADFVVTQSSPKAFDAMVFGVPTLLFAEADFHHALVRFQDYENPEKAIEAVIASDRNFDKYLKWYLDDNMISAQKPDSIAKTMEILQEFGWPVTIPEVEKTEP